MTKTIIALVAVAAVLTAAGCGDDGARATSAPPTSDTSAAGSVSIGDTAVASGTEPAFSGILVVVPKACEGCDELTGALTDLARGELPIQVVAAPEADQRPTVQVVAPDGTVAAEWKGTEVAVYPPDRATAENAGAMIRAACAALGGCSLETTSTTAAPTTTTETTTDPLALKIMAVGDSITQGTTAEQGCYAASYLCYLDHLLREAGVSFDFVGGQSNPHGGPWECPWEFDHDHEGYWGKTIDDLTRFIPARVARFQPDVVLLYLGANNLEGPRSLMDTPEEAAEKLAALIRLMQDEKPDLAVFVAQEFEEVQWRYELHAYNEFIASFAELSTETSSVYVVDMATGFPTEHFAGHPDHVGAAVLAERWMVALQKAGFAPDTLPDTWRQDLEQAAEPLGSTPSC